MGTRGKLVTEYHAKHPGLFLEQEDRVAMEARTQDTRPKKKRKFGPRPSALFPSGCSLVWSLSAELGDIVSKHFASLSVACVEDLRP